MAASEHRRGATLRLLLRVARVLVFTHGLGYIHPDEHFQSSEVTARALLSLSTRTAWEWCTPKPARSIVSAFLSSGVPHWLERWWHYGPSARYYVLIYGPRVWLACLSLVLDAFCASIGQNLGCADAATTVLASSWPVLAFFTRPFSNTIEALLAGATLYMAIGLFRWRQTVNALSGRSQKSHSEAVLSLVVALSGVISAVGVFVRFTFILFAGPSLAFLLWHGASVRIPGAGAPRRSLDSSQLWRLVRVGTLWMVCAGGTALALCIVDSMYFHHLRVVSPPAGIDYSRGYLTRLWGGLEFLSNIRVTGGLVLTPFNSLLYNMDPSNLQEHGLHPRFLHAAVNMPMLVGPLIATAGLGLLSKQPAQLESTRRQTTLVRSSSHSQRKAIRGLLVCSIVVPLMALSVAPHQEPRFLLPLVLPLVLLGANDMMKRPRLVKVWVVFNALGGLFFSSLHQGGVLRVLQHMHSKMDEYTSDSPWDRTVLSYEAETARSSIVHIAFVETYMPPAYPLQLQQEACDTHADELPTVEHGVCGYACWSATGDIMCLHDIGGGLDALSTHIAGLPRAAGGTKAFLVAPGVVPQGAVEAAMGERESVDLVASVGPHVSMEHVREIVQAMWKPSEATPAIFRLNVFRLRL